MEWQKVKGFQHLEQLIANCPNTEEEIEKMKHVNYRSAVVSLIHAANNKHYDISEVVGVASRFFENPGLEHWKAVKRIFRYLKCRERS